MTEHPSFDELDYIANMLHQQDGQRRGQSNPRWWCLRDDLKAKWRRLARTEVLEWVEAEKQTMANHSGMRK